MLYLALFYYLWIIIADQSMSFHGQVGGSFGQISILAGSAVCQSSGHCAILKKKLNWGGWGYTSLKTTWNFYVFYFTLGNSRQNKTSSIETPRNCTTPPGTFNT